MGLILAGEDVSASRLNAQRLVAIKTADELRTSAATPTDDLHLFVTLDSSTTYLFEFGFFHNTPAAATGFKTQFTTPAGLTGVVNGFAVNQASFNQAFNGTPTSANNWPHNSGADVWGWFGGRIVTTNGGTLRLQWCQNTSNAASVTLRRGSYLRLVVVA